MNTDNFPGKYSSVRLCIHLVICAIILCAAAAPVFARRGRVQVIGNKVLSDMGTPLRGVSTNFDNSTIGINTGMLQNFANNYGLNSVHVYADWFWSGQPGRHLGLGDQAVRMAADANMYCIIVLGNWTRNGESEFQGMADFWNLWAPRYRDEPHVIYEMQNEPTYGTGFNGAGDIQFQLDGLDLIRSHAPNTHVILFSFAVSRCTEQALQDVREMGLDWEEANASVGMHVYPGGASHPCPTNDYIPQSMVTLDRVMRAGFPVINTEWESMDNGMNWDSHDRILKATNDIDIGWQNFIHHFNMNETFKSHCNGAGIAWRPDYGSWPRPNVNSGDYAEAVIEQNSLVGRTPFTVDFDASRSIGGNKSYSWNFGNGETSTDPSPSVTFEEEDEYLVTCIVSSGQAKDTNSVIVEAYDNVPIHLEAEKYEDMEGLENAWGTECIGSIDEGDWAYYGEIDFGDRAYMHVTIRVAVPQDYSGQNIDVRVDGVDGEVVGTITVEGTADWSTFGVQTTELSTPVSGVHDLYITFPGDAAGNIDYFRFTGALTTSIGHANAPGANTVREPSVICISHGELFVNTVPGSPAALRIIDISGRTVLSQTMSSLQPVAIHSLAAGHYMARIYSSGKEHCRNFAVCR
jgi:hypothetical protein